MKRRVPAIEGWFTMDDPPHLLGSRCAACGTSFFPAAERCRNPHCGSANLDGVKLSRTGKVWSHTTHHYAAPPPFVAPEPFEPYTIAAVELDDERMIVLGRADGPLRVGDRVELGLGTLYEDDDNEYVAWRWRPA